MPPVQMPNLHEQRAEQDTNRGREVGTRWARRAAKTGIIRRLVNVHYIGAGRFRSLQCSPHGTAYDLFVAMYGPPDIAECESRIFDHEYIPASVREFWEGVLGWEESVDLANQPAFAKAFLAAAMQVWDDLLAGEAQKMHNSAM